MLGPITYGVLNSTGGAVTILQDTFTDTNSTAIASHALDINTPGGAYTQVVGAGTCTIQSNMAQCDGSGDIISKNAGIDGSFTFTIEYTPQGTLATHGGIIFRIGGSAIYFVVGNDNGGSNFIIGYRNGGAINVVDSTAFTFSLGVTYTIVATVGAASDITATLNGGNTISGTAAVLTGNNTIGFKGRSGATFDNLLVTV